MISDSRQKGSLTQRRVLIVALLILFTLLYFAASIHIAKTTPLTVDEVFVTWIVRYFPGWHVVDALKMGLDSLPPGYYWLAQACTAIVGPTSLAIRLPAIFGFYLFALSVFYLLLTRVQWPIAAAGMFFTCVTAAAYASTIGRPYALVAGGFGLAAAAWVDFPSGRHRALRCVAIWFGVAMPLAVHFLAIYGVAALGLAELLRSSRDRKVHWSFWLSLVAGSAMLLLWAPLILPIYRSTHVSIHSPGFYAQPTLGRLFAFFVDILQGTGQEQIDLVLLAIAVPLMLVAARSGSRLVRSAHQPGAPRTDGLIDLDILTVAAFSLPIITLIASRFVTGSFNERYFIAAVLGVILLLARGLDALPGGITLACVLLVLTADQLAGGLTGLPPTDPRVAILQHTGQPLPVVIPSGSDFFFLSEAVPPEKLHQIAFVGMPPGLSSPDTEPEMIARRWKAAVPAMAVYTWKQWVAAQPKTFYVLYSSDPREGLTEWLLAHQRVEVVSHNGPCWLFEVNLSE